MQSIQISSKTHQDEQIELIEIVRLRNQPDATPLDIRKSDWAVSKLLKFYENLLVKLTNNILGCNAYDYYYIALDGFYKAIESFKFGKFSSWVVFKVKNALLDWLRQSRRAEKKLPIIDTLEVETISTFAREEADLTEINNAISQLTDYQQEIIWYYKEGYTWPEIGQRMGKNHDALRMEMHRALASVREILGIEKTTVQKKKAVPVMSWMRRMWDRFQKSVRIEVNSDDIKAVSILPRKYVLSPLMRCLVQASNVYQSGALNVNCQSLWAICRGVVNTQQAPPFPIYILNL